MPASAASPQPVRVLYLSYDGMTDPLGRSQVLPYLKRLATMGHRIRLLSLDKPDLLARDSDAVRAICADAGIDWRPLTYRAFPPVLAGWWNRQKLSRAARGWLAEEPADIVHARSDLAASAALPMLKPGGPRLLWDMRALWADERIDSGQWDQSRPHFRLLALHFRRLQQRLIERSDGIVTLSRAGARWLEARGRTRRVAVIPCGADFDLFQPDDVARARGRAALGIDTATPLLLHLGSIGGNVLLDEMIAFLAAYSEAEPDARLLFVAPGGHERIRAAAAAQGLAKVVLIRAASREEVPGWIAAADLGLFFVRPGPSKVAASPTKLGEMLAVGLPVVTGSGIGDVDRIIADCGAGVVVDGFDTAAYRKAAETLSAQVFDRGAIRDAARHILDVDEGARSYDRLYVAMMESEQ